MNFKKLFILVFAVFFIGTIYAQDKIFKTNGDVLDVKVKTINTTSVVYVFRDNVTGPEYTILKTEVEKIRYKNGTEDVFNDNNNQQGKSNFEKSRANYSETSSKPHIFAFSPFQFTENGVGIAVNFEKALDKEGLFAFYFPIITTFNLSNNQNVGSNTDPMFYIMPGIKYYPYGSFGKSQYAIGPSLVLAGGQKTTTIYDGYNSVLSRNVYTHTIFGIILNNSLNMNATDKIYVGLDFGFGFCYINSIGSDNKGMSGLVQGGFKMGFRY